MLVLFGRCLDGNEVDMDFMEPGLGNKHGFWTGPWLLARSNLETCRKHQYLDWN